MRAFLALALPAALRRELAALGASIPSLRALDADAIHLTIRFLGEIEHHAPVVEALEPVAAAHPRFEVELKGVRGFPESRRAGGVWISVGDGQMQAGALAVSVQQALFPLGFSPDRRAFRAHVTLGRFRTSHRVPPEFVDHSRDLGRFTAERLVLYRSILTPEGAIHEPEAELSLGRAT